MREVKVYHVKIDLLCDEHIEVVNYHGIKNISENGNFVRLETTGSSIYIPINRVKYMIISEVKI